MADQPILQARNGVSVSHGLLLVLLLISLKYEENIAQAEAYSKAVLASARQQGKIYTINGDQGFVVIFPKGQFPETDPTSSEWESFLGQEHMRYIEETVSRSLRSLLR